MDHELTGVFPPVNPEVVNSLSENVFFNQANPIQTEQYQQLRQQVTLQATNEPSTLMTGFADVHIDQENQLSHEEKLNGVWRKVAEALQIPVSEGADSTDIIYAIEDMLLEHPDRRTILFMEGLDTWNSGQQNSLGGLIANTDHKELPLTVYGYGDLKKLVETPYGTSGETRLHERFVWQT